MNKKAVSINFLLIILSMVMIMGSYKYVEYKENARNAMCSTATAQLPN